MKKQTLLVAAAVLSLAACNTETKTTTTENGTVTTTETVTSATAPAAGFADVDLSAHGLPLIVKGYANADVSGDGATGDVTVSDSKDEITRSFDVSDATGTDLKALMAEQKNDATFNFQNAVKEDAKGYIAKLGTGYVVSRIVNVGGKDYHFRTVPLWAVPDEAAANALWDAFGQARAK